MNQAIKFGASVDLNLCFCGAGSIVCVIAPV